MLTALSAQSGSRFHPGSQGDCVMWCDPSDASTVQTTGTLVDQVDDKSGNGNHFTASGGDRPLYDGTTINGLAAIEHDGSGDYLTVSRPWTLSGPVTIFIVWDVPAAARMIMMSYNNSTRYAGTMHVGNSGVSASGGTGVRQFVNGVPFSGTRGDLASLVLGNGPVVFTVDYTATDSGFTDLETTYNDGTLWHSDAAMGEVIVYDELLADDKRDLVTAYLLNKWTDYSDGGSFNPEADITWHSLFWAEGTDFTALGLSDGGAMSTYPNETGESDLAQATSSAQPTYRASTSTYNNQPTVELASGDYMASPEFSSFPVYTSGVSLVVIGNTDGAATYPVFVDGIASNKRQAIYENLYSNWTIMAGGTARAGGTADTSPHLFVGHFDGSSGNESLSVDGTSVVSGLDAGDHPMTGITIGANYAANSVTWLGGHLSLVGVYEGDITSDSEWSNFTSWVDSHYGITIA